MSCSFRTLYALCQPQLRLVPSMDEGGMNPTVEAEQATRRAQVVEALADDVGRALTSRGRRCRRVTLDARSLLHPAGPGAARLLHRAGPGDDLVLVDGCFLQHPETRAFFAPRAASWEQHFPDDDPAYGAAVAELALRPGQTALDAGCGTGRALPHLRTAVGEAGHVLGFDLTPEMLATARRHGRQADALLVLADARRLPLPAGSVDGAFAAGLLPHLPDPGLGLAELARVIALGGRLVLFHPSGRAALAARHGRRLREDDLLAPDPLRDRLQRTGWWLARYDDGPDRFLAVRIF